MNEDLFAELLTSVREGGAILRGERAPSRSFEVDPIQHLPWKQARPRLASVHRPD